MKSKVSIIIPCFNERVTITSLLQAIFEQTYPTDDLEVVIADGMSTDGTRQAIRAFSSEHPELTIHLIDNPQRIIPAALNRAIRVASGEVIIRLDAHSIPNQDYVERCLTILEVTGAAMVGGVCDIRPLREGWLASSIAIAVSNRLGAADARYRTGGRAGEVDTVPFVAFRREWVDRIGPFDESLLINEDYEFNFRIRQAEGVIWFDPSIRSTYFARSDLASLARQYACYGYWKHQMLRRHPQSLRWRQALPPLFVLTAILLGVASIFWYPAHILLEVQLFLYGAVVLLVGMMEALRKRDMALLLGFPLAVLTIHFAWGGAFLWSILTTFLCGLVKN